ncbi:MAG: IS607 family transposase [Caldilineaceae bacterium]|nr:IS607 family transposase [Caldilineaceae bacterium]
MDKVYSIGKFGKRVGRSPSRLREMDRKGIFRARWTATGRRYYTEADALRFLGEPAAQGVTVVYCRVSRRRQQADLQRQVAAMETYCLGVGVAVDEWLTEIGGGLNFKRKVFLKLMERIEQRAIAHLLIAHQDRLTRFGFDWFAHFAEQHGCTLTVVNQESLSPPEEMVEDLMAIVHTFSGRLYGLRSYQKQLGEAVRDG